MTDLPTTYSTGTISVGANSTTVTGTGTAWAAAGIRAGDMVLLNGLQVRIATVVSNTQITLARGWPGAAATNANYDILFVDDGVRSLVASNQLLQALLGNGSLAAIGGLVGAANQLPYFTGAGAMATTALTAAARTLLDDASVGAMRATLELPKQSSVTDATGGRMMSVGAFGLGGDAISITAAALDDVTASGFYRLSDVIPNVADAGSFVIHVNLGTSARQLLFRAGSDLNYIRRKQAGAWQPWVRQDPERGTNGNGTYVRFADGTQICYTTMNSSTGGAATWTFPSAFVETAIGQVTAQSGSARSAVLDTVGQMSLAFSLYDSSGNRQQSTGRLTAIGRWF